jgi:hypothetical protein
MLKFHRKVKRIQGQSPQNVSKLHIFDYNPTGQYQLTYGDILRPPTGLAVVNVTENSVTVSWSAPAGTNFFLSFVFRIFIEFSLGNFFYVL